MDKIETIKRLIEAITVRAKWRSLQRISSKMERDLSKAFKEQGRRFLAATRPLAEARPYGALQEATIDDWLSIFDTVTGDGTDLFFVPIQAGIRAALTRGAGRLIADLGIDYRFRLTNPRAETYLDAHGYGLISQIDSVTRGNIATIVSNGVNEGWSYDRVAREISGLYREMAVGKPQHHIQSRAHLIAVTEAGNAYEEGNQIVVRDLADAGLRMEKRWLTVGDDRVSDGCRENEAEGWIPIDQAHQSGHLQPLRFPGCRCTEQYRRARG